MSLKSILSALNPFAIAVESDLDKAIKAIQNEADAAIAKAKLQAGAAQLAAELAAKRANWTQFKADYEAFLAKQAVAQTPAPANPTGATGPYAS